MGVGNTGQWKPVFNPHLAGGSDDDQPALVDYRIEKKRLR